MEVLEGAVAALEASLAEANQATSLWQYLLVGAGCGLILELLARPVWVRLTGRAFPLDALLDRVLSPVVERALVASHLVWARTLGLALNLLRRCRSRPIEVIITCVYMLLLYTWYIYIIFVMRPKP